MVCLISVASVASVLFLSKELERIKRNMKTSTQSSAVHPHRSLNSFGGMLLALGWLTVSAAQAQTTNYALGTSNLLVGPASGTNSVVLAVTPATGGWTATTNAPWLHLSTANQSGTGSTNVIFSYDANPGPTRSGTLTIGDQTLTFTQAGSTYVEAGAVTTLASSNSGLGEPYQVAVDRAGNVYIADGNEGAIQKWTASNNTLTKLVSGLGQPTGVALDGKGNVYISIDGPDAIDEWTPSNSNLISLASGLNSPVQLAVDEAGNVYFPNYYNDIGYQMTEWIASNNSLSRLSVKSPTDVAMDMAGNLYYTSISPPTVPGLGGLVEWVAAYNQEVQLAAAAGGLGVAVDASGNVYVADAGASAIKKWSVVNRTFTTLLSNNQAAGTGVAVDGVGNLYFSGQVAGVVDELPHAFVDPTPKLESLAAGSDVLPAVVPTTANLLPPFAPTSDQAWLTITGVTNGVVSFSFTTNTGPARMGNINLLGQNIPVTQGTIGTPPVLMGAQMIGGEVLQFSLTNTQTASLTVLSTTNMALPLSDWTVVGTATNTGPGQFQFTSQPTTNDSQRFYVVRSP
jgi:sugar lactone lactonase YvrE